MATVHIPRHMQNPADGHASVEVPGGQLSSVIEALLQEHPSLRSMLMVEGSIRSDISIAINSAMTDNGLLEQVPEDAEVHLVPALGGGA